MAHPAVPKVLGLLAGILAEPMALRLASTACGGHGCSPLLYALFPYLSVLGSNGVPIALVQMPFYGFMIGRAISGGAKAREQAISLAAVHAIAFLFVMVAASHYP